MEKAGTLKWIAGISSGLAIAAFLALFGLYSNYLHMLPRSADGIPGRVFPVNDHGIVVYQNRDERRTLLLVEYTAFSALAVAVTATVLKRHRG